MSNTSVPSIAELLSNVPTNAATAVTFTPPGETSMIAIGNDPSRSKIPTATFSEVLSRAFPSAISASRSEETLAKETLHEDTVRAKETLNQWQNAGSIATARVGLEGLTPAFLLTFHHNLELTRAYVPSESQPDLQEAYTANSASQETAEWAGGEEHGI